MVRSTFYIFIVLISVMKPDTKAQRPDISSDLILIYEHCTKNSSDRYKRPYIYKNDSVLRRKLNPVNVLVGGSLYLYQNVFSRQISATCLYNPSCSDFSKNAILQYGLFKGSLLSADRVWRCNGVTASELKYMPKDQKGLYPDPIEKYKCIK